MNHLLMGKFALVNSKGRRLGPPPGAVPPPSHAKPRAASPSSERKTRIISGETLHWKDALDKNDQKKDDGDQSPEGDSRASSRRGSVSSSSTSTELCDDPQRMSDSEDQTASLSEPPDRSQPSTPRVQPKIVHSLDLDSCKEDPENKEEEESLRNQCDEVDQLREEIASISSISPGDDDRPHRRKPSSFRIDPEELRQLDRKLSLKIVEIERRKSSAGIESDDLNSKVLFPFDRDYLGDGEKSERADSPSSIPDDRLCCTEDFVGSFEDENIPVPDLITTHKPINFRMSSLEECDETKLNDVDPPEMYANERGDYVDEELKSYNESEEISDEEYEQEECQNNFNFDDLFPAKEEENKDEFYEERNLGDNFQNNSLKDYKSHEPCSVLSGFNTKTTNMSHDLEAHKSNSNDLSLSSRNQNDYENPLSMNITSSNENKELNNSTNPILLVENFKTSNPTLKSDTGGQIISMVDDRVRAAYNENQKGNLNNDTTSVLDDKQFIKSCGLDKSSPNHLPRENNMESHKNDEEDITSKVISYQVSATETENPLKVKGKFDIRSSLALSNALPDVTAVSSSDFDIDSMRKKYANFGQISYERLAFESLDVKTSLLNGCKDSKETAIVTKDDQSILGVALTDSKPILDVGTSDVCSILGHVQSTEGLPMFSVEQSNFTNTRQSGLTIESQLHVDELKSRVFEEVDIEDHSDVIMSDLRLKDIENIPQQASPSRRRGSEVALNLILKENSQILTKIQQQTRRSSEIWADSKSMNENETSDVLEQLKDLRMSAELRSLNNVILESLDSSGESNLVPYESISEKTQEIDEIDQVNCLHTNLKEIKCQNLQDHQVENHDRETDSKVCDGAYEDGFPKTDELNKEIKGKVLPDVCKYDFDYINQPRFGEHKLTKRSIADTHLENNDLKSLQSDIATKTNCDSSNTKLDTNTNTSPTTTDTIKTSESVNYTDKSKCRKLSSPHISEHKYLINIQNTSREILSPIADLNEAQDKSALSSLAISNTQRVSDANEDIIKELRYLDIKPEEILDYSTNKKTPLSTPNLEDHLTSLEKNLTKEITSEDYIPTKGYHGESYNTSQVSLENFVSSKNYYRGKENSTECTVKDKLDNNCMLSKEYSKANNDEVLTQSLDSSRVRSGLQKSYRHHKSASIDIVSHDKLSAELDKPKGSFARSATTVEDDNSMYMNSYKSHGRLLIEKGELKTHRISDEEMRKSTDAFDFDRSAYDFKKSSGNDRTDLAYSRFSSETSKLPESSYVRPTEKMLFRYKSEDHGLGTTPPRCRFSSASPIRTRLDSFSADTDFRSSSAVNRTKSPSPTLYRSSPVTDRLVSGRLDSSSSDYSHSSKDYSRYSRTESLDSSSSYRPTGYLRRKTESFESFTEQKKVTSPSSPVKFNPFPVRSSSRQPKDLGVKLGLYLPSKTEKSPTKRLT